MAKTKKVSKLKDDSKWAWLMLAPNIIGFLLFMLIPMVATFVLSFTKYDMLSTPKFVGLQNYIDMVKGSNYLGSYEEYHCVYNTYCSCWECAFPYFWRLCWIRRLHFENFIVQRSFFLQSLLW